MPSKIEELRNEVVAELQGNILPFWLRMQDPGRGGFYGRMRGDGTLEKEAPRGAILNARILWSFSAAYRVLGGEEYLAAAENAKDYILRHFIDRVHGGCFWEVDANGRPTEEKKQFYAIGFMIYGLSEFYRATADEAALREALALYQCIESHAWDIVDGGYIEALTRDWQPIADMRLSELDANYPKSQNTHLHIIEPYTNLYRAALQSSEVPSDVVEQIAASLRRLLHIFTDRILNPATHHLDLFFSMDWQRGAGHLESYGHDIECSWLMHETALVLADSNILKKVEPIVRMVAEASEKGLNPDGSMTHEANLDTGRVDDDRHWWVQAEAVVGFFNIYQHFHDPAALDKALRCWRYIKQNLIDREGGEWYWSCDREGRLNLRDDKAGFWKCPYHNSRMCLELIERLP